MTVATEAKAEIGHEWDFERIGLWMEDNLKLINKEKRLVPFILNKHQRRLLAWIWKQYQSGMPVRIIILKARQLGMSTFIEGLFFAISILYPYHIALVAAHTERATNALWKRVQRFQRYLPDEATKPCEYESVREITWYVPHDSRMFVQTAGDTSLGRADTMHLFHASELPQWKTPEEAMLSVMQCLPKGQFAREGMVVIEATAKGASGEFYNRWCEAYDRFEDNPEDMGGFIPLFFSWLDNPEEYSTEPPDSYDFGEFDEDEQFLLANGATIPQLYWRRVCIRDDCGGNVDFFKQEYPSTPEEAFLQAGRRAIPEIIVKRHRKTARPGLRATFHWNKKYRNGVEIRYDETLLNNYWEIWEPPRKEHDYAAGCDVASGQVVDRRFPEARDDKGRYKTDFDCIGMLDRVTLETAARLHVRMDADLLGEELRKALHLYNYAYGSPETNNAGVTALLVLKRNHYSRIWRGKTADERVDQKESGKLGWVTTGGPSGTRRTLFSNWIEHTRPDNLEGALEEERFANKIICYSENLAREETTCIRKADGVAEHAPGCWDDELFAWMIALIVHLTTPRTFESMAAEQLRRKRSVSHHYAGGHDEWAQQLDLGFEEHTLRTR